MYEAYNRDLKACAANYTPLSPLSFLRRTARAFPERAALIHGRKRLSYAELERRAHRFASALQARGISEGDTVSVLLANTPPMVEVHYGVPIAGAVLNTINTRLDAASVAYILDHAEAKVFIVDKEFSLVAREALSQCKVRPLVIDYEDPEFATEGQSVGEITYEAFVASGSGEIIGLFPRDEWDAITLNYTSGTTGRPKGVVYHHRGAYLNAVGNLFAGGLGMGSVYLWTLPMFHCNGWCFPWSIVAIGGTQVCLRWVRAEAIYERIATCEVTHLCGAPTVMLIMIDGKPDSFALERTVAFLTAAAPPPEAILRGMEAAGFKVTHLYGLTETYGPSAVSEWHPQWDDLDSAQQTAKKARQGLPYITSEDLTVIDPETMKPVAADGETLGEAMFRGNAVMKGYLKNEEATSDAFAGGWFHTGDLGVLHADGYVELKDRSKDIIISGGENISSIEVENALYRHEAVLAVAVVARPDPRWGETPCAFVELKSGTEASESDLMSHCRAHLPSFKMPRLIVFGEVPKTSTGKIQKFKLRERAKNL